jgi:serine/threonine protein kinase
MDISSIPSRFSVEKMIGQGNFGVIYRARDTLTSKKVAIKLIKYKSGINELQNEIKILSKLQGGEGIPSLEYSSKSSNFYAMKLLGQCLNDRFLKDNKFLSESNFALMSEQLLTRLEFLHSRSIIHRDIKPHQLILDRKKHSKLYLIDFGLSKPFQGQNGTHIAYSEGRPFAGTFNYASLNAHLGIQQSRRDDLESFCYVLAYFVNGDLPWRLKLSTQNEASIRKMKISLKAQEIFPNRPCLAKVFTYVRSLKFDEEPNYEFIKSLLVESKKNVQGMKKYFSFKQPRSMSTFIKKKEKRRKLKSNTFLCASKDLENVNDCSVTLVDKNYPEMKRTKIKTFAEAPTSESIKTISERSCVLF